MTLRTQEPLYTTHRATATANNDNADTDLLVVEVDKMAQLSNLQIGAPAEHDFRVEVRDQDGSNNTIEARYSSIGGGSDGLSLDVGSFTDPVVEIGASREVAIINSTALSADDYSINVRVDELTG